MRTNKTQPRFVPTLTEVVDPSSFSSVQQSDKKSTDEIVHLVIEKLNVKMSEMFETEMNQLRTEQLIRLKIMQTEIHQQILEIIPVVVQEVHASQS